MTRRTLATSPAGVILLCVQIVLVFGLRPAAGAAPVAGITPATELTGLDVLIGGAERATGRHRVFRVVNGRPVAISPPGELDFFWPTWAYGGSKIVLSGRIGPEGSPEQLYLMNPDGTGLVQLTANPWRNQQPKVSPDGRSVLFTSSWSEFQHIALYRLDLSTLQVTNLSAHGRAGAFDADPRFVGDGDSIVFANTVRDDLGRTVPTQIDTMRADGTNRRHVVSDSFYNVDPAFSPDGRLLTYSSFRGKGHPRAEGESGVGVKLHSWFLPIRNIRSGKEILATRGVNCTVRPPETPCRPDEPSAFNPVWLPDGSAVGYLGALSSRDMCVCLVGKDGRNARVAVSTNEIALTWVDWKDAGASPMQNAELLVEAIGKGLTEHRLLFVAGMHGGGGSLWTSTVDRWGETRIPLPADFDVQTARWNADRTRVVFSARAPLTSVRLAFTPQQGPRRNRHFPATLPGIEATDIDPTLQVFSVKPDGSDLKRLTTPTLEDWRDAVPDGELRANTDPEISPDGHRVMVTNLSPTGESFLLSIDLRDGTILNLSNATAGINAVADSSARFSPDGTRVVFTTNVGNDRQVATMKVDGTGVQVLTDAPGVAAHPAWSPDGRSIVFAYNPDTAAPRWAARTDLSASSTEDAPTITDWQLRLVEIAARRTNTLTKTKQGAVVPTWTRDNRVIFTSTTPNGNADLHVLDMRSRSVRPLQVTQAMWEVFSDVR